MIYTWQYFLFNKSHEYRKVEGKETRSRDRKEKKKKDIETHNIIHVKKMLEAFVIPRRVNLTNFFCQFL